MEENLSDIVRDFKLSTRYDGGFTIHFYNDPDAPPSTPQRQERWGRVRTIGNGSQGTVVLENCVQGARNFTERAVKKIPLRSSHSTRFYERELAAIIKFSHDRYSKYFVKSLGWYTSSGRLNIAMEYFPEGDLFTYVEKLHGLPEDECREITSQIVSGISLMHAERHPRDGRSSTWWIKLGDFGICKRDGTDTNTTNFTPGTETYMAPELLNPNLVSLSPRDYQKSDVWALGITVFFILTNTVPFSSRYSTREFATNLGEPFPCAPLRGRNVSAEGQAFIRDAIKPKPEDRMDAAKAMEHAWINGFLPCCPVSGTYMETSTTTSIQSSLDEMGGLTNEILTLASQTTTLNGFLSQPSQNGSIPRPAAIPMQILHENNNATIDIEPMRGLTASLEEYWGLLVTPHKTPSFIFCDLIGKIFDHFNVSNTGMLQPHELCAFMYAARWLPQFPPIQVVPTRPPDGDT
ncbi:camk kinase [Fusarium longipes]|uniref:mitogen-activated protein kinase kinase n=1 Tax=Fusarium longipes TaxID=694270 RepID=A0A395T274_9HYPO|nr:camk kinase [Fusarium longipes]